ncbi:solanidine UDP-glucose glucosyltransferase 1-like [Rutidosis leptorrhynchoides]|uniref:solanidine UDP-glucose glucosyltransferase 1-like n=1 Tax=Rutidosis leptorrhynchoides TaxID=125765 RepID=UPI003A9963B3
MASEKKSTIMFNNKNLHVIFLPFFTSSHIIPLVHAARLFSARGVRSTVITTVHNALIFQSSVTNDIVKGHPISIRTINFPSSKVGLPVGIENVNSVTSLDMTTKLFIGMSMLQKEIEQLIRDLAPDCIFSDMFYPWTVDLADELNIPRLLFYPSCFLYHSMFHSLKVYEPQKKVNSESEWFLVPNLPDQIMMKRSQVSEHLKTKTGFGEMIEKIQESEKRSYGLVHNTFYEIEPAYVDHIKKIKGPKVWHIGPLFQFFIGENREKGVYEKNNCLSWLDDQRAESVIYVCFGSMVKFPEAQITEIALALEESKQPFIWVVRKRGNDQEIRGLPQGFEERIVRGNMGLIMTGWAPQVEILEHPAVGGFLTHCGWNSVLEAVVAGVPLMTWPLYAEHFYNEKLVQLLGIGVGVGADVWNPSFEIISPIIEKRAFIEAIQILTDGSAIGANIKRNSRELATKTKKVVGEGGSSVNELTTLIEELKAVKLARKP